MKPDLRTALQPRAFVRKHQAHRGFRIGHALQAASWSYRPGAPGSTGNPGLPGPAAPGTQPVKAGT